MFVAMFVAMLKIKRKEQFRIIV